MPSSSKRPTHEWRDQLRLALPLAAVHAGQQVMATVDTAVVGRLGAVPIAAVGLGGSIYAAAFVVAMGLMMGLDPLVSQAVGAGNPTRARQLLWQGCWLALILGVLFSVPMLLAPMLLEPMGIAPDTARETARYLNGRAPGLVPGLMFVAARAYLQAFSTTRPLVISILLANVANLALCLLFVHGGSGLPEAWGPLRAVPAMGVTGAAWATTLCVLLQLAMLLGAVRAQALPANAVIVRAPVAADVRRALGVGFPLGVQMGAEMGVFTLVGLLAGRLGTLDAAVHQIAIQVASLSFTVALGASAAGSVRVGHAVGRGDAHEVRRRGLTAFAFGASFMGCMAALYALFPGVLARALTDDMTVVAASIPLLRVAAVFQLADGVQAVGAGVLRGAGDTRFLGVANIVGHYVIGLPIALFLGFSAGLGITGLWWGLCAGLFAVAVALFTRFVRLSGHAIRPLEGATPA